VGLGETSERCPGERRKESLTMEMKRLYLALLGAGIVLAAAACAPEPPEPAPTVAPTSTTGPAATAQPTVAPDGGEAPAFTEEGWAYMQWLAGVHGKFQEASEGLIDGWQAGEAEGAGQVSAETLEEMEGLTTAIGSYVEEVQAREDVPEGVADIHTALLDEVGHWEVAAPLLLESVNALADGDQATFEEKSDEAVKEIEAAVDAREALLAAANELLEALQAEDS
jgi:hypothetical protein